MKSYSLKIILAILLIAGNSVAQDFIGLSVCPSDIKFAEGIEPRCTSRPIRFRNYHETSTISWKLVSELPAWLELEQTSGVMKPQEDQWIRFRLHREFMPDGISKDTFYIRGTGQNYDWTKTVKVAATKNLPFGIKNIFDKSILDSMKTADTLQVDFAVPLLDDSKFIFENNVSLFPVIDLQSVYVDSGRFVMTGQFEDSITYSVEVGRIKDIFGRSYIKNQFYFMYAESSLVWYKPLNKSIEIDSDEELCTDVIPESFSFQSYPNPFKNVINFIFESRMEQRAKVLIYNILGQQIQNDSIPVMEGFNKINMLTTFPAGVYFIEVKLIERTYLTKMIKVIP